ncbi:response regulator, partial [Dyadobacter sediminis]|uniref:response regulator n=1 Tax=Dyadobacter sediminis TaxID=1493691 RepID=UPI0014874B12
IMNGYQVCEHIRNQSWGRYLSIIAYTGRDSPSTSKDALATGFDKYVLKPAQYEDLSAVILTTIAEKKVI